MQSHDRNSDSQQRIAPATPTDGRTDGRTTEIGPVSNRLNSATRAHVQADDGSVEIEGHEPTRVGSRFPVIRTGERDEIPWDVRSAVHRRDGMRCVNCAAMWEFSQLTLDHITPWSAGGSDESFNLRTLCYWCNERRSNINDGAHGRRVLSVTWWCIECHGIERETWPRRPDRVRPGPDRISKDDPGLIFAYCAVCDINSYTTRVL